MITTGAPTDPKLLAAAADAPRNAAHTGLRNQLGWLVTICTEQRWQDFVVSACSDAAGGAVRSSCLDGDARRQAESWLSQEIVNSKTDPSAEKDGKKDEEVRGAVSDKRDRRTRRVRRARKAKVVTDSDTEGV